VCAPTRVALRIKHPSFELFGGILPKMAADQPAQTTDKQPRAGESDQPATPGNPLAMARDCREGAMLVQNVKSSSTRRPADPISRARIRAIGPQSVIGTLRRIDAHQSDLIAAHMRAITNGSEPATASGGAY